MRASAKSIILLLGACASAHAVAAGSSPEGYWLTEKKDEIIEIFRCGGDILCGRLAWFRILPNDPNPQALDLKNPDPGRRGRSLCGLTFINGFRPVSPDSWEGGAIYDPENGNTYHAKIQLQSDGALRLRGYIGISLIGRSEVWTRYTQPVPTCPSR